MADDRYDWLDKDTAEQLLRGEQVSARHGDGARELEQLLEAAAAVAARTPEAVELPGEEAAVAAFRQAVRHGSGARNRTAGAPATGARTAHTADLAERTRLGRPVRRGFAVALAACAIGGVAVAAGTGVLPTPFRGGDPAPASSVSAVETPGPFRTGEPGAQTDGTTGQTPDATPDPKSSAPPESPRPGSSPGASKNPGSGAPSGGTGRGSDKPGGSDGKETGPGHGDTKNFLLGLCQTTSPASGTAWTATRCGASNARPADRRRCTSSAAPTWRGTRTAAARAATTASAAAPVDPAAAPARAAARAVTRTTKATRPGHPARARAPARPPRPPAPRQPLRTPEMPHPVEPLTARCDVF